jgi:hypothetical protein
MKSELSEQKTEEKNKETGNYNVNKQIKSQNKPNKLHFLLLSVLTLLLGVIIGQNMQISILNKDYLLMKIEKMQSDSKSDNVNETDKIYSSSQTTSSSVSSSSSSSSSQGSAITFPKVVTLSNGTYKVGKDITSGIYNLTVVSGCGQIHGDLEETYLSELMGDGDENYYSKTYKNLHLKNGDEFEISGGVTIEFVPVV